MIDWNKPIQTKMGLKAEFIRKIKTFGGWRYLVIVTLKNGMEQIILYFETGVYSCSSTSSEFRICVPVLNLNLIIPIEEFKIE